MSKLYWSFNYQPILLLTSTFIELILLFNLQSLFFRHFTYTLFLISYCIYLLVWFNECILLSHLIVQVTQSLILFFLFESLFISWCIYLVPCLNSYFLVLSHFFLLHLFIELNSTVSFNFSSYTESLGLFLTVSFI